MHAVANVQDTSASPLESAAVLSGVFRTVHLVPSHCSVTSVSMASLLKKVPTAMHLVLSVQDTRPRSAAVLPCGEAIVCSAQLVPFQRSARPVPVAVHAAAAVQDTPSSWLTVLAVLGVLWMAQLDPFQTSASVAELGPVNESPTASQSVAEVQETPPSSLFAAPLTLGVVWMVQELPFQPSARVCVVPPLVDCPTASHDDADLHETSLSWLAVAPPGWGWTGWTRCRRSTPRPGFPWSRRC